MSEWRLLAEWDWVQVYERDHRLHAVEKLTNEATVDIDWVGHGRTVCGHEDDMAIPGLFTRMATRRCPHCCARTGMPEGKGSPKNDDACRPLVEQRLAALTNPPTQAQERASEDHSAALPQKPK